MELLLPNVAGKCVQMTRFLDKVGEQESLPFLMDDEQA